MHAGSRLALAGAIVLALIGAAWLARYSIAAVPAGFYLLDRWTGHVYACEYFKCTRVYPPLDVLEPPSLPL